MKRISIFGSTGEIGSKMVDFVHNNLDNFEIVCLACCCNYKSIIEQARRVSPKYIVVSDKNAYEIVKNELKEINVLPGEELNNMAMLDVDMMGMAISGSDGVLPSFYCLGHAKMLAIANKEAIVVGGNFFVSLANDKGTKIVPVDSEHNAIYQCLVGENFKDIEEIILTCSGGPFVDFSEDELKEVSVEAALQHPKWKMGRKNTIDSATIMNKALEILEASFLFDVNIKKIKAIIHRESIVHGMITFRDSMTKAVLSYPDMMMPISYALNYPKRFNKGARKLDLTVLSFEPFSPWQERSINFAYRAYEENKCIILNTINEKCVNAFLNGSMAFGDIQNVVEKALDSSKGYMISSVSELREAMHYASEFCSL